MARIMLVHTRRPPTRCASLQACCSTPLKTLCQPASVVQAETQQAWLQALHEVQQRSIQQLSEAQRTHAQVCVTTKRRVQALGCHDVVAPCKAQDCWM